MAANTANVFDPEQALDLEQIRASMRRMEDSIIFSLVERAQYKRNMGVYEPDCEQLGKFKLHQLRSAGSNGCLGDWFIYQTECLHSQVRRYLHPTEFSFFHPLPEPTLGVAGQVSASEFDKRKDANLGCADILAAVPASANVNQRLLDIYRSKVVPHLCEEGDDCNHGSTAVQDVLCLQSMATRLYYGLFAAESKVREDMDTARALIAAKDKEGLREFITKPEIEAANVQRVILKARTFSQNIPAADEGQLAPVQSQRTTYKISPELIGKIYREFLIPLTKDIQVEYLLHRPLDFPPSDASRKRPLEP